MSKTYTWEEVAQHKTKADCWVVFEGKVLNITNFLAEHPGGEEVIMDHAGKDITQPFEDIGHSENAKELTEKYAVGKVVCICSSLFLYSSKNYPVIYITFSDGLGIFNE